MMRAASRPLRPSSGSSAAWRRPRELAYRLYAIAERTKRTREALWYNALVQSWPEIASLAREQPSEQATLLEPSA